MLIKNLLLPTIMVLLVTNFTVANAENNGIIFPPMDNAHIYQYPPQGQLNSSNSPPYTFGKPNAPQLVPPANMQRYSGRQIPAYSGYPMQRPVAPFPSRGRSYPSNSRTSNNSNFPFSNNMMPFGNGNNNFNPFSSGSMPFGNNSSNGFNPFSGNSLNNPMNNMFGNNNSSNMPFFGNTRDKSRKKAWGTDRNIWPDFYTDFTDDSWDTMMGGPRDMGEMPGGWHFPYISTPDPVTVSDAITNQFPPIMEEGGNMMDFSEWGLFD